MLIKSHKICTLTLLFFVMPIAYAGVASDSATIRVTVTIPARAEAKVTTKADSEGKEIHSLCVAGSGVGNYRVQMDPAVGQVFNPNQKAAFQKTRLNSSQYSNPQRINAFDQAGCEAVNQPEIVFNNQSVNRGDKPAKVIITAE